MLPSVFQHSNNMSRTFLNVLIVTTVCLSWYNGLGSAMKIDITPNKAHRLVHHEVDIYCKLEKSDSDADIKEVLILELVKGDGSSIATLRQNSHLITERGMGSKIKAKGKLSVNLLDNYLHVTLSNPDVNDAGTYTCNLFFLDETNFVRESKQSADLSVSGSALNFDITPNEANRLVQDEVTIHCNMEYSGKDVTLTQITSLELTRYGDTIAVIDENSQINIGDSMESKFKIEAKLSSPPSESYLHAILLNPDINDTGLYTCQVHFQDELSLPKTFSKSANLTVLDHDVKSALQFLVNKMSYSHEKHRRDIDRLLKDLDRQRNDSMTNKVLISSLDTEINRETNAQERDVDRLRNEVETQANASVANQVFTSTIKTELNVLKHTHKTDMDKMDTELDRQTEESESSHVLVSSLKIKLAEQIKAHERDVQVLKKELDRQRNESRANEIMTSNVKKDLASRKTDHSEDVLYFKEKLDNEMDRFPDIEEALSSLKPTIDEQTGLLKTKIDRIEKKMKGLKNVLVQKGTKLDDDIKQIADQIKAQDKWLEEHSQNMNTLKAAGSALRKSAARVEQDAIKQFERINTKGLDETTVLFRALHTGKGPFGTNKNMIYSNVIVNEGEAYDGETGIFTSPVDGYYIFSMSVTTNASNQDMYLDLKSNDGQVLTTLFSGEWNGWNEHSDTSCVVKLEAGEQVRPFIRETVLIFVMSTNHPSLNKFNGYLLKTL